MSLLVNSATGRMAQLMNRCGLSAWNVRLKTVLRKVMSDSLVVEADGFTLQGPVDAWTLLHQLQAGRFERAEASLFVEALGPGMTVLDIGANIGYYALLAARSVETGGRVYAFEPDPRSYRALAANMTRNGFENVHLHNAAVAAETGTRRLFLSAIATHSGLHRSMEDAAPRATEVATVRIDDLGIERVDVIKMDIEGGEPAALEGMSATLARSPTVQLFLEFNPAALRSAGCDPDAFANTLLQAFEQVERVERVYGRPAGQAQLTLPVADELVNLRCAGIKMRETNASWSTQPR